MPARNHRRVNSWIRPAVQALAGLALGLGLSATAWAVPASPDPALLRQPNGATFLARLWGDEWLHGYETSDGFAILRDEGTGYWHFATAGASGELTALSERPGVDAAPPGLERHVRPSSGSKDIQRARERALAARTSAVENSVPPTGTGNIPVFLITSRTRPPPTLRPTSIRSSSERATSA